MRLIFKFFLIVVFNFCSIVFSLGTNFLLFPENASSMAMGRHPSLGGSESVNPALIEQKDDSPIFHINSGSWFGNINLAGLNYIQRSGNYNNRFFIRHADVSDLEFRDNSPSDNPISKFSAYAFQFGAGVSRSNKFGNFGMMLSYLSLGIYDQKSDGLSIDIGYSKLLSSGFGLGVSIINLGYMSKFYQERPELPSTVVAGISNQVDVYRLKNNIYFTSEYFMTELPMKFKLGADIQWGQLNFLVGYSITKFDAELSIGGGIKIGRFKVIYATRSGSQEIGEPKILSINYRML